MEWVETTGRTIEEALDAALDELGVDEKDVEYEVMSRPRGGLFGRFGGDARSERDATRERGAGSERGRTSRDLDGRADRPGGGFHPRVGGGVRRQGGRGEPRRRRGHGAG